MMKYLALAVAACLAGVPFPAHAQKHSARLDAALKKVEASGFRGVVLAGDSKRTVWTGRTAGAPPLTAIWPWASVSKQLTSLLVMQEVEAGRLSLDDTLAMRLPNVQGCECKCHHHPAPASAHQRTAGPERYRARRNELAVILSPATC